MTPEEQAIASSLVRIAELERQMKLVIAFVNTLSMRLQLQEAGNALVEIHDERIIH